jgi:hypothetical protein
MHTKKQVAVIALVALGVIAMLTVAKRAGAGAMVSKVPLVGPLVANTLLS